MNDIRVIIADDDQPSRTILKHFVQMLPDYEIVGEATTGDELLRLVMKEKPDVALVDIEMPDLNGVEAVKTVRGIFPSLQVIFTTGHDDFAVEAFNLSAMDYVVKPIERSRLWIALEKCKNMIEMEKKWSETNQHANKLAIKSQHTFVYLNTEDIFYIERENRKSILHTVDGQFETTESLAELEEKLPKQFYKTHRSYLVNLDQVRKIVSSGETYLAYFNGDSQHAAYISKLKINDVQELLNS